MNVPARLINKPALPTPSFTFYLLIFYAITALYLIPYGTFAYADSFIPILSIILLFELVFDRIKLNRIDLILILFLLLITFSVNFSLGRLADAFNMIALSLVCRNNYYLNRNFVFTIYWLSLGSIIYQLAFYRHPAFNIPVLSILDPNFSGFLMLLFFFFCFRNNFKIGLFISIACAFIFFSRAYLLSLFIFICIFIYEKCFTFIVKRQTVGLFINKLSFLLMILLANSLLLVMGTYFINNAETTSKQLGRTDLQRVTQIADESNLYRFQSNERIVRYLIKTPENALLGLPPNYDEEKLRLNLPAVTPHNGLLHLIFYRGIIFCSFYFLLLGRIIKRLYQPQKLKYLLALIVFSLFLHVAYFGPSLIFFVTTLATEPRVRG